MQIDTFANRLKKALVINNMTQAELSKKTKLDKSLISHYLAGTYKAKQDNLTILADILNVSEPWLMGYDVSYNGGEDDKLDGLFYKYKDILTTDDIETIKFIIEKRKREIDKQLKEN